jgi:hypothetical protein
MVSGCKKLFPKMRKYGIDCDTKGVASIYGYLARLFEYNL